MFAVSSLSLSVVFAAALCLPQGTVRAEPSADGGRGGGEPRIVAADADGDGDVDLWVVRGRRIALYANDGGRGDGGGIFRDITPWTLPAELTGPALAVGDLNGDGHVDALGSGGLALGAGATGTFVPAPWLRPSPRAAWLDVALADVDGDGDLDVWAVSPTGRDELLRNDGAAGLVSVGAFSLPRAARFGRRVALRDLDRDGDVDALVVRADGRVARYDGAGDGTFQETGDWTLPAAARGVQTVDVELADVDHDGWLDAVLASARRDRGLRVWIGGPGGFVDETAWRIPPSGAVAEVAITRDRAPLLVTAPAGRAAAATPATLVGLDGRVQDVTPWTLPHGVRAAAVVAPDLDGDLRSDLAFVTPTGALEILLRDGDVFCFGCTPAELDATP